MPAGRSAVELRNNRVSFQNKLVEDTIKYTALGASGLVHKRASIPLGANVIAGLFPVDVTAVTLCLNPEERMLHI